MVLIGMVLSTGIHSKAAAAKVDNNNNTISTAADISLDTTYAGNSDSAGDEDWYHFVIPATAKESYFNIVLGPEDENSMTVQWGWGCYVYKKGEAESFLELRYAKRKTTSINLPFGPGEYYLKIEPEAFISMTGMTKENYNFSVMLTDNAHWETEGNDDWTSANRINVNETYHGNLFHQTDEDCYTFVISNPGEVIITLGANASEDITKISSAGWQLSLYKENEDRPCAELRSVITTTSSEKCNLGAGTYRIRISGGGFGAYNPGTETYDFSVGYKAAQNDTTSIKESKVDVASVKSAAKKQVYLKWKKNKYADGYKVYRSTKKKKGYKCIATLKKRSKVSYTDKKVKSKKVYYYKVRAYRKVGKKTVYSAYSPVKKVKVK